MGRRHAIVIGFNPDRLALHQRSEAEALAGVGALLAERGFSVLLPGLYAGDVDAVRAVMAVQDLAGDLPWFAPCLGDARLLRIEEEGDLTIALT